MYKELLEVKFGISREILDKYLEELLLELEVSKKKILLIPPDYTRFHSYAGEITQILVEKTKKSSIDILPALGTHIPMITKQINSMYANIPLNKFITHNWRNDIIEIGLIPESFIQEVSKGILDYSIKVEINRFLLENNYDLILSIGQVVPHEVAGMANGAKNILIGVGGSEMINKSHFLGACYGMDRIMGRKENPVRKVFNYASNNFLDKLPIIYIQTVVTIDINGNTKLNGLFTSEDNRAFDEAANLSQKLNITLIGNAFNKILVYLDPEEYQSTWLGNKAIYRTRMAIESDGELIIIAPGLNKFGEDKCLDRIIRKYGYLSTNEILKLVRVEKDLQQNLSAAAHLIHGSSENKFKITYSPGKLTKSEIINVNYNYQELKKIYEIYDIRKLKEGKNSLPDGEEILVIKNPALGLWSTKNKFNQG
ncbi:MAG: lactate racemase domain-containing protein [Candidatus Hodarchaeales archaeon]